jgi:hypothetical protein
VYTAGTKRLLGERTRRREPPGQVRRVRQACLRLVSLQPRAWNQIDDGGDHGRCQAGRHRLVDVRECGGAPQQDVIPDHLERIARARRCLRFPSGRVVEVQRRAVIDEPDAPVPHEHVRVPDRPIDVCHVPVEPDDSGRQIPGHLLDDRVQGDGPGQVVEGQVQSAAVVDERVDLGIRLRAREVGVQLCEDELRDRKAGSTRQLAADELGDERLRPLT